MFYDFPHHNVYEYSCHIILTYTHDERDTSNIIGAKVNQIEARLGIEVCANV